ncbi:hypothetical protein [Pedobacter endophyticus]|uniref:Uncharacterized protein n=1 Tax=Pedobacter endophyticus TaxID=2789740 RepID=A0A7S9PYL6_9SPHI|nr:hypothetical protein [Pedobacter endophyticus]QPH39473.1 hypothetical protein IZT61_20925 [Pedobacter endophyticus]
MSKTFETGLAKNVANFETLISYVVGYGPAYNPSNAAIQLSSLQAKAETAKAAMATTNELLASYTTAVAARKVAFEPLSKLSTRIFNSLKATTATQANIDNAESNHRKLQGRRASAVLTEAEKESLTAEGKTANQISASQRSFDNQLETLDKQIKLLSTISAYNPNETELQLTSLRNLYNDLLQKNRQVINDEAALSSGRIARDKEIDGETSGMISLALTAKDYTKSLFGQSSQEFKQISGLSFSRPKI